MATKTTKKAEPKTSTAKTAKAKEAPATTVAADAVEETAKATTAKKPVEKAPAKKTAAKKTTTAKTTAAKRTTKKAKEANTEVYVQFWGKEVYAKEVVENIKKIWTEEMGKKAEELEDLKVYIKPEENGAHYVINGDVRGFLGL